MGRHHQSLSVDVLEHVVPGERIDLDYVRPEHQTHRGVGDYNINHVDAHDRVLHLVLSVEHSCDEGVVAGYRVQGQGEVSLYPDHEAGDHALDDDVLEGHLDDPFVRLKAHYHECHRARLYRGCGRKRVAADQGVGHACAADLVSLGHDSAEGVGELASADHQVQYAEVLPTVGIEDGHLLGVIGHDVEHGDIQAAHDIDHEGDFIAFDGQVLEGGDCRVVGVDITDDQEGYARFQREGRPGHHGWPCDRGVLEGHGTYHISFGGDTGEGVEELASQYLQVDPSAAHVISGGEGGHQVGVVCAHVDHGYVQAAITDVYHNRCIDPVVLQVFEHNGDIALCDLKVYHCRR